MKKRIFQLFVAASFLSFVFVNYNAVTNTVNNSNTSLIKLFSISFANAENPGNCVYCGNNIDNCTCNHVDACPSAEYENCYEESGYSVTNSYTTTTGTLSGSVTVGILPSGTVGTSTGWTHVPQTTTTHYAITGQKTNCTGPENDPSCFSTSC